MSIDFLSAFWNIFCAPLIVDPRKIPHAPPSEIPPFIVLISGIIGLNTQIRQSCMFLCAVTGRHIAFSIYTKSRIFPVTVRPIEWDRRRQDVYTCSAIDLAWRPISYSQQLVCSHSRIARSTFCFPDLQASSRQGHWFYIC